MYKPKFHTISLKILPIFIGICLLPQHSLAKKLYKYKDEQGNWHYTDKQPQTKQQVDIKQLKAATKRYLWLEQTGSKNNPDFFVINNYYAPIEIEISLEQSKNVISNPSLPRTFIVQPGNSETLFKIASINKYKASQYSLQYRYTIGNPQTVPSKLTIYSPPFATNTTFQVSQAFGGKFSHQDKQNQYAVDMVMPVNTPVHAARSGKVIEVNDDYYNSGTQKAYNTRANSIRILHDDGSMAIYAHLALETTQVYTSLKVSSGQLIGYSGNTGFSTGPHLHFAVQINAGMELISIPFKFSDRNGTVAKPMSGDWLEN